jgi:heat-inducible transcriptional repressor
VFVEVQGDIAERALAEVTLVLNERLAGLTLGQIRATVGERLRDATTSADVGELLNIFVEEGEALFDATLQSTGEHLVLGQASLLAEQPEFSGPESMRRLLALTETPERLAEAIRRRNAGPGIAITIGTEHDDPRLGDFTVITTEYHAGPLSGVIGVIGPTRMPYEKVISLVSHTSRLLTALLNK